MSLNDIVSLTITVQDKAPTQQGFGTPLLFGYHTAWPDRVREYADADEMLDDGFSADHYLYKAAQAVKSQNPSPDTLKIGRRATALTQVVNIIPTSTEEGFVYKTSVNGTDIEYTVGEEETVKDVVEGIEPLVEAVTGISSTEDDTKIVATTETAGTVLSYSGGKGLNLLDATADTTTGTELAAIAEEDDDWYGLVVVDSSSKATAALSAAWTETQRKVNIVRSADYDVLDPGSTTDTFAALKASAYERTAGIWHSKIGGVEWIAEAWMGRVLPTTPGSATWAFKTLAGIAADSLRQGQQNGIRGKNGTHYTNTGGLNITFEGKTFSGSYLDIIHFVDWLYARIRERVLFHLTSTDKIPYTDAGVDVIRSAVLSVLKLGINAGGLAADPAPTVTAPKVADVPVADRINRLLPDVKFTAQLAGALHSVRISGLIAV